MRKRSLIIGILSFIILLLAGVGFWAYCLILAPDFEPRKTVYVYIDEKKDFDDLCRQLVDSAGCQRIGSFKQLAGMRGLMADTTGHTIELPIKSNFREGLEVPDVMLWSRV